MAQASAAVEQVQVQAVEQSAQMQYLKEIVMRQTDYTDVQALEKLNEHNNNITTVIREYMFANVKEKTKEKETLEKSTNQQIYHEIRSFMDNASLTYNAKKEKQELLDQHRQHYIEQVRQELERRKNLEINP